MRPSRLIAFLAASTALHVAVMAPGLLAWRQGATPEFENQDDLDLSDPDEEEGELPIEPLLDTPFHVSLFVEPVPIASVPAASPAPPAPPAPTSKPVVDVPIPVALPLPAEVAVAAPDPVPPPPAVPEPPLPEPTLTDADRAALAAMENGEATGDTPAADDDGQAQQAVEDTRQAVRSMKRARNRAERHPRRPPCPESSQSIARVAEAAWYIDRDLIEYYATHMGELQKLGSVWTHRDKATNELDGFRVALSRCSVLREGGLKSGDIVHDINGRRIHSVLQAIGAYIALRKEPELYVRITRKGEPTVLAYTIEQPVTGRAARAARKAAREKAAARGGPTSQAPR
ncbi:MAG: hypothetical protein Q8P18_06525 [Pseudomonadota bacterium]|nr:hypothetical protein [Pseudomonadota bacterium]